MSVSYDSYVDIGESQRMAPTEGHCEGIITEDNIQELTEMATAPHASQSVEPQEEQLEVPSNKMEAPIKDKVSRKKNRSEKQKATFEKARQKRLENIAKKKAERKAVEEQVAKDMDKVKETPMTPSSKGGGYGGNAPTTNPELPSMEEQVKELEEIQNEVMNAEGIPHRISKGDSVIKQEPILKKPKKQKRQKVVYVEPSSSSEESSEEEVVYVRQRKPQRKPRRKVVYQDDYGEEAEFRSVAPPRRTKPISFSDVFKYA